MRVVVPSALLLALALVLAACEPPIPPRSRSGAAGASTEASPAAPPAASPAAAAPVAVAKAGEKPAENVAAKASGNPDNGRKLILSQGCGACHTLQGVPGAAGNVGPDLTGVASRAGQAKPGMSAEAYLHESIVEPLAYTVQGFQQGLMPKLPLSEQQANDLVAFLMTQQ